MNDRDDDPKFEEPLERYRLLMEVGTIGLLFLIGAVAFWIRLD